jgi:predicted nucleotidyltransferase component of viral defense system
MNMIKKEEIDEKSIELSVNTSDIQRDYVFGWLLSGIHHSSDLMRDNLVLKGGNCFRKGYFENTRYSNDLDFSAHQDINPDDLQKHINTVCGYVSDSTGVKFALEDNVIKPKKSVDEEEKAYEARVYFKGFYGEEKYNIKVTLDIKEFDKIYLPTQKRNIIHPYSDYEKCTGEITCLKLEELLASKLNAMLHRSHSPDLYDFIYSIFFQNSLAVNRTEIMTTFLKKTIHKPNPQVAKNLLLELPFNILKGFWNKYLVCPKRSIIDFDDAQRQFCSVIPDLFALITPSQPAPAFIGFGRPISTSYFSSNNRSLIIEAGQEQKLLRIIYDGIARMIEPYALKYKTRKDGVSNEYFYAWDRTGGRSWKTGIKALMQDKIQSIEKTNESFEPRFEIELTKSYGGSSYFGTPFSAQRVSKPKKIASFSTDMEYTIECSYCNKRFKRKTMDTKLNKHKDRYGNQCYGRIGYRVY